MGLEITPLEFYSEILKQLNMIPKKRKKALVYCHSKVIYLTIYQFLALDDYDKEEVVFHAEYIGH